MRGLRNSSSLRSVHRKCRNPSVMRPIIAMRRPALYVHRAILPNCYGNFESLRTGY